MTCCHFHFISLSSEAHIATKIDMVNAMLVPRIVASAISVTGSHDTIGAVGGSPSLGQKPPEVLNFRIVAGGINRLVACCRKPPLEVLDLGTKGCDQRRIGIICALTLLHFEKSGTKLLDGSLCVAEFSVEAVDV